jgi:hypothetical protein
MYHSSNTRMKKRLNLNALYEAVHNFVFKALLNTDDNHEWNRSGYISNFAIIVIYQTHGKRIKVITNEQSTIFLGGRGINTFNQLKIRHFGETQFRAFVTDDEYDHW